MTIALRRRTPPKPVPPRSRSELISDVAAGVQGGREAAEEAGGDAGEEGEERAGASRGSECRALAASVARQEGDECAHGERSERHAERLRRPARAAGYRREADGRSGRAKRRERGGCRSRGSRAEPRARKSPATFRQARPSRTPVAANSTQSGCERLRRSGEWPWGAGVSSSVDARKRWRRSAVMSGKPGRRVSSSSIALNQGCRPACACAAETSGRRRARICIQRVRRFSRSVEAGNRVRVHGRRESRGPAPRRRRRRGSRRRPRRPRSWGAG